MSSEATGSAETDYDYNYRGGRNNGAVSYFADGTSVEVFWDRSTRSNASYDIFQVIHDASGEPVTSDIRTVNQYGATQLDPDVAVLADGSWVVTWSSIGYRELDSLGISYAYFNPNDPGRSVTDVRANKETANAQTQSSVASLVDGGWVITWTSDGHDGDGTGIYQRRFPFSSSSPPDDMLVNTQTAHAQSDSDVAGLADGGWVVTWTSSGQGGAEDGIYQQRYNASGVAQYASDLRVDAAAGGASESAVVGLPDGGWVVVWTALDDGSDSGIYQQRYDAAGATVGSETLVNVVTAQAQFDPEVYVLADGGWTVNWGSMGVGYVQRHFAPDIKGTDLAETLSGTKWGENLLGFDGGDTITGGAGDDIIDGGGGTDIAVFAGKRAGYTITENTDGSFTVTDISGFSGTDTLTHVELARFDDVTSVLNHLPVLKGSIDNQAISQGAAFNLTVDANLYSDPDGNSTLSYQALLGDGSVLPAWLHFKPKTRILSGVPANDDVGTITVKIVATDSEGASVSTSFDIDIANVNDPPSDIKLSADTIAENAKPGALVGKLSGVDIDLDDTLTFSLKKDASGLFDISGNKLVLAPGAELDFETARHYRITVSATDNHGLSYSEVMTINVTDVIEPVIGTSKANTLHGTSKSDFLMGLGGNDILDGGEGADRLDGGVGSDTAIYVHASTAVIANLLKAGENTGEAKGDTYVSIENLTGSRFNDRLTGTKLDNRLDGGRGNDMLTGGAGSDTFVFGARYGRDTISDFIGKGGHHDVVDLSDAAGIVSYKDLIGHHLKDTGHDLLITAADGSKLILADINANDIASSDFLF